MNVHIGSYFQPLYQLDPLSEAIYLAALIQFLRLQNSICNMRVILELHRMVLQMVNSVEALKAADQVPKDIHTVLHHYDLDPHCHAYVAC